MRGVLLIAAQPVVDVPSTCGIGSGSSPDSPGGPSDADHHHLQLGAGQRLRPGRARPPETTAVLTAFGGGARRRRALDRAARRYRLRRSHPPWACASPWPARPTISVRERAVCVCGKSLRGYQEMNPSAPQPWGFRRPWERATVCRFMSSGRPAGHAEVMWPRRELSCPRLPGAALLPRLPARLTRRADGRRR